MDTEEAVRALDRLVRRDVPAVRELTGSWVPQVSSKCVGLPVDLGPDFTPDGVVDTTHVSEQQILALHLSLVQRQGAIITTARALGVRSVPRTCSGRPLWVSLVPSRFEGSAAVLSWCDDHGFPSTECAARMVPRPGQRTVPLVGRD